MTGGGTGWAACAVGISGRDSASLERLILGAPLGCSSLPFPVLMVKKSSGVARSPPG